MHKLIKLVILVVCFSISNANAKAIYQNTYDDLSVTSIVDNGFLNVIFNIDNQSYETSLAINSEEDPWYNVYEVNNLTGSTFLTQIWLPVTVGAFDLPGNPFNPTESHWHIAPVPEPETLVLLIAGLPLVVGVIRRQKRRGIDLVNG